jgi:hypothetical protein
VNASSTRPCVLTLVNTAADALEVLVTGTKVGALAMSIAFPYNLTQFTNANTTYEISAKEIVTYLYIGSTNSGQYSSATVKWN